MMRCSCAFLCRRPHAAVSIILLPFLLTAPACAPQGRLERTYPRPRNAILVSLDTLRADHLGFYGYPRDTSPSLNLIASKSTVFRRCYAQAAVTLPSHMSIFTGLYPHRHGVTHGDLSLPETTPTLSRILSQSGFSTAAFTGGGFVRQKFGYHGFDQFQNSQFHDATYRSEDRQFDIMLEWISEQTQPFFLFWHSYRVHSPYNPPPEDDLFTDPGYQGIVEVDPETPVEVCQGVTAKGCRWKGPPYFERILPEMQQRDIQHVVDKYDGEVRSLDRLVGRFWQHLDESGLRDETLIIIVSDHGESFVDRAWKPWIGHGQLYREILHVPLIVYVPGMKPAVRSDLVETIDILPTVLRLLGIQPPGDVDGVDLFDQDRADRPSLAQDWDANGLVAGSVARGRHHLIRHRVDKDQLFNLEVDPSEQTNLIDRNPEAAADLARTLAQLLRGGSAQAGERIELDDETVSELEALGYL